MYLITGGAGFIGSNLVAALCDLGRSSKVVVVDNLGIDQKWKNIAKHLVYDIIPPPQLDAFLAENKKEIESIISVFKLSEKQKETASKLIKSLYDTIVLSHYRTIILSYYRSVLLSYNRVIV